MKYLFLTLFLGTFLNQAAYGADIYKFDKNNTSITWSVNHFGFSNPSGKFTNIDGKIIVNEKTPSLSSVELAVNIDSFNTGIKSFDDYLNQPNVFDSANYKTAKFVSTRVVVNGRNSLKVVGNLTIKNITQTTILDVKLNKIGINKINGKKTIGFSATTEINRSKFGMSFGIPDISDRVKINIEAEGIFESEEKEASNKTSSSFAGLNKNSEWKIDYDKSSITFAVKQKSSNDGGSLINGGFKKFLGRINFDVNNVVSSKIEVEIETDSVFLFFEEALATLKGERWLSTKNSPIAYYSSSRISQINSSKKYNALGVFKLKEVARPLTINFEILEIGNDSAHVIGNTTINRNNFNIGTIGDSEKSSLIDASVEVKFEIFLHKNLN